MNMIGTREESPLHSVNNLHFVRKMEREEILQHRINTYIGNLRALGALYLIKIPLSTLVSRFHPLGTPLPTAYRCPSPPLSHSSPPFLIPRHSPRLPTTARCHRQQPPFFSPSTAFSPPTCFPRSTCSIGTLSRDSSSNLSQLLLATLFAVVWKNPPLDKENTEGELQSTTCARHGDRAILGRQ